MLKSSQYQHTKVIGVTVGITAHLENILLFPSLPFVQ